METSDLLALAWRLAPHSNRVRAALALLGTNPEPRKVWGKPSSEGILRRLVKEVLKDLGVDEDGVFIERPGPSLPDGAGVPAAVEAMKDELHLKSGIFQAQEWRAERAGADARLLRWIDTVCRKFRSLSVPVYPRTIMVSEPDHNRAFVTGETSLRFGECPHNSGFAVELAHGVFGTDLPPACWEVFKGIGLEVAVGQDFGIEQSVKRPAQWVVTGWRDLRDQGLREEEPVLERRNYSRSPSGEREFLLRYYGLGA